MPSVRRSVLFVSLYSAILISASCSRGGEAQPALTRGRRSRGPATVAVAAVARRDLARSVTLAAPVEPVRTVGVNSRASGTILTVRVIEGDRVRPGQLMAELDSRETAAQLEQAQAALTRAEAAFRRSEQMHASQIITNAEFEQTQASFETAKSDVDLWRTRLEFGRVVAPSGGVITAKYVEAGSAVSPNQRLFDLADDTLLVVRVQMSELDVVHVRRGDAVEVQVDAFPGSTLRGRVRRIFPSADPETRLVPVEVALAIRPGDPVVRPGFLARVTFGLNRRAGAMVVPAAAVGSSTTGPFVYVVQADTLVRRPITTGLTAGGFVEVHEGLDLGELVVTSGHLNLRSGAPVRVAAPAEEGGGVPSDSPGAPVGATLP